MFRTTFGRFGGARFSRGLCVTRGLRRVALGGSAFALACYHAGPTLLQQQCPMKVHQPPTSLFLDDEENIDRNRTMSLEEFRSPPPEKCWVHLNGSVYDVTDFLEAHPGGAARIQMVNGQDLAAFWAVYSEIHSRPHIRALLEEYKIGQLSPEDQKVVEEETKFTSYYTNDPIRPKAHELRIPSHHPWNSEPIPERLVESFFTPNDIFFVRNHNNVPEIEPKTYRLEVAANPSVGIKTSHQFSLHELQTKFPRVEVISALQCAGNRQEDYVTPDRPLYVAPHWRNGAIGNAKWAGVRVRDVFGACGMPVDEMSLGRITLGGMKIVNFIAEDEDETGVPYAGVIPIEKALDVFGDAILAYEMNGETLPRDHGYPIRLLAPGHAGCRNVKWVKQIIISAEASELDSGSRLDRHFAPDISWTDHRQHVAAPLHPEQKEHCKVRVDQGPVIQTLPVQSIIAVPPNHAELSGDLDEIEVKGIAWSGAGRGIVRVELSVDGGETFTAAELQKSDAGKNAPPAPEQGMGRNWAWTQYSLNIPIPNTIRARLKKGEKVPMEIVAKAIDGDFNSQPERMSHTWNVLGICVNHWPRVNITLDPNLKKTDPPRPRPREPEAGSCMWPDDKRQ